MYILLMKKYVNEGYDEICKNFMLIKHKTYRIRYLANAYEYTVK